MSKSILVTGGASSGKSRWAVTYLASCDYVLYLSPSENISGDTLSKLYSKEVISYETALEYSTDRTEMEKIIRSMKGF